MGDRVGADLSAAASGQSPAAIQRVFTLRAFILGSAMSLLLGVGPLYTQFVNHTASLNADSITAGAIFLLFLLTFLVATALRKIYPPWAFATGELVVIYTMMIVASTIPTKTLIANMIPVLPGAAYYATPENDWAQLVVPLIPDWMVPQDPLAIKYFYEGAPADVPIPWQAWLVPFFAWGIFIAAFFAVMISSMVIVRRQWVENERLVFPLIQVPMEMLQQPEQGRALAAIYRSRLTWLGFAIPWIVLSSHGLHAYVNYIPEIATITNVDLIPEVTAFHILLSFSVIGFTYLVNQEIAFSLWFFHVLMKVQSGVLSYIGYDVPGRREGFIGGGGTIAVAHEAMGATVALVLFVLWTGRKHLAAVFGKALGTRPNVEDHDEIMSYRAAVATLLLGLVGMCLWLNASGMPLWLTPFFVLIACIAFMGLTRIIAEGGVGFSRTQLVPAVFTTYAFGTAAIEPSGLSSLGFTYTWASEIRSPLMAAVMHALKMLHSIGIRRPRPMLWAIALAAVIGVVSSGMMTVWLAYTYGGINLQRWAFVGLPNRVFEFVADKLRNPVGADITAPRAMFTGLGAATMAALMYAQHRFINWPLHYLGLPIATSRPISVGWFSIMIGWLFKLFIVRYGGVHLYRSLRPFFIGLIIGQISCSASWMILDFCTGMVGNWVSVGVP
jgi:hypothetical protein